MLPGGWAGVPPEVPVVRLEVPRIEVFDPTTNQTKEFHRNCLILFARKGSQKDLNLIY